jgi:2-acylglycerol O-acyltransferase 2
MLVPVFSFGETELYDQLDNPEGSRLRYWQEKLRKIIGIAPVIFLGRGIFQYSFGMVPHRRQVTVLGMKPLERFNPRLIHNLEILTVLNFLCLTLHQ